MLEYESSCRLCLSNRGNLPIFESPNDELGPICSRIFDCLSVEVCQSDTLPKQICQRCLSLMNVWYFFKLECDSAQLKLKRWFSTYASPSDQISHEGNEAISIFSKHVNIKLEPADECMTTDSVMGVDTCLEEIDSNAVGDCPRTSYPGLNIPGNSDHGNVCDREGVSQVMIAGDEHLGQPDSLNLVITETSSVTMDCSINEANTEQSAENDIDDENLIRLALESSFDSSFQNSHDHNMDEVNITYESSTNIRRPVLELNLEDSNDGETQYIPNDDIVDLENTCMPLHNTPEAHTSNWKTTLVSIKKEVPDELECGAIQIEKEVESCGDMLNTSSSDVCNQQNPSLISRNFHCSICRLTFKTKKQKYVHEKRKHKEVGFSMNEKVYNYSAITLSKVSNELFDEARTYCYACQRKFSKGSFWRHIKAVHIKEDPFKCEVCKKIFPGRRELVTHRVRTISRYCRDGYIPEVDTSIIVTLQEDDSQNVVYQCKTCSETFSQLKSAETHTRVHTGRKPFFCYKCNLREFVTKKSAWNHVSCCKGAAVLIQDSSLLVSKSKEKTLPGKLSNTSIETPKLESSIVKLKCCPSCNKSFESGIGLSNHMRVCQGPKQCSTCSKTFARSNFARHIRVCDAENAVSFVADSQNFDSSATPMSENATAAPTVQKKNARITKIVDLSVKELKALHLDGDGKVILVCKLCDKPVGSRKSLHSHLLKHSGQAYKCQLCSMRMCHRSTYESHMIKVHKGVEYKISDPAESYSADLSPLSAKPIAAKKFIGFKSSKLKCDVCHKLFSSAASLNYHKLSHKKVKCKLCETTFPATMEKSHVCPAKSKQEPSMTSLSQDHPDGSGNQNKIKAVQFMCDLCNKRFHTRKILNQHKKMHIKMKIYKCKICDNSYSDAGALQLHKQMQHGEELLLETTKAEEHVSDQHNLSTDTPVHQKHPWECVVCLRVYSCKESLARHKRLHEGCQGPLFVGGEAVAIEKPESPGILFCSLCSKSFDSRVSFLGHKGWHSRQLLGKSNVNRKGKLPVKSAFNDSDNSEATCSGANSLKSSNSPKDYFRCDLCNKKFTSQKNLNCHLTYHKKGFLMKKGKHLNEKQPSVVTLQNILPLPKNIHRCKICLKSFLESSSLLLHMKYHTDIPGNSDSGSEDSEVASSKQELMNCKLCNKEYRSRKSLKLHMLVHSGEKPYKCRSCSNRYSNAKALSRHERERHTNVVRPFSCNRCTTSFMAKEDLVAHYEKCTH